MKVGLAGTEGQDGRDIARATVEAREMARSIRTAPKVIVHEILSENMYASD
jgi:hypothetical protein